MTLFEGAEGRSYRPLEPGDEIACYRAQRLGLSAGAAADATYTAVLNDVSARMAADAGVDYRAAAAGKRSLVCVLRGDVIAIGRVSLPGAIEKALGVATLEICTVPEASAIDADILLELLSWLADLGVTSCAVTMRRRTAAGVAEVETWTESPLRAGLPLHYPAPR